MTGKKQMLPMPRWQASQARWAMWGPTDRSSRNRVGRDCKESAIALKSASNAIKNVSSKAYAVTIALVKGSYSAKNNPRKPGNAAHMDRSSPRSWCHSATGTRRKV